MKTNKILFGIAIAVVLYLGVSSFELYNRNSIKGSGTLLKESRELAIFHSLEVSGTFNVTLKQGSPQSVVITTDDNLMPHVITKVKNGELEIYTKGSIQRPTKLKVEIVVQNIDEVDLSGACNLQTTNYISSNEMEIEGSGASTFKMRLKCKKLSLDFSGASNGNMIGSTKILDIVASGASSIDCSNLNAEVVNIDASGASSVEVIADKLITVDASGASSVEYSGKASVTVETSGASSVEEK